MIDSQFRHGRRILDLLFSYIDRDSMAPKTEDLALAKWLSQIGLLEPSNPRVDGCKYYVITDNGIDFVNKICAVVSNEISQLPLIFKNVL
jgi:hypothetical protein